MFFLPTHVHGPSWNPNIIHPRPSLLMVLRTTGFPESFAPKPLHLMNRPRSDMHAPLPEVISRTVEPWAVFQVNMLFQSASASSDESRSAVFTVTYERLPRSKRSSFSDRLEITSAPLTFTLIPGLLDRLKTFFTSHSNPEGRSCVIFLSVMHDIVLWVLVTVTDTCIKIGCCLYIPSTSGTGSNLLSMYLQLQPNFISILRNGYEYIHIFFYELVAYGRVS